MSILIHLELKILEIFTKRHVVKNAGVCVFDFFCSGVQFYVLLGQFLCFVSFLCLDFCVLGDGAWMGWGSFMQTKHLCVLIHIWTKGEVGAVKMV